MRFIYEAQKREAERLQALRDEVEERGKKQTQFSPKIGGAYSCKLRAEPA
jgi:hypothetical protein